MRTADGVTTEPLTSGTFDRRVSRATEQRFPSADFLSRCPAMCAVWRRRPKDIISPRMRFLGLRLTGGQQFRSARSAIHDGTC